MQMTLAFLEKPEPPKCPTQPSPPPAAWDQRDEAARIAALEKLATQIARMLAVAPAMQAPATEVQAQEASHE